MKFKQWTGQALLIVLLLAASVNVRGEGNEKAIDDYNFAAWLYNSGKYGLAVDSYQAFLKNYPKHEKAAEAQFGLAQSLFHLDRYADAAARYEEVRSAATGFSQMPELLFQLGQSRAALTQYADAEKLFAELQEKFADHYLADWALARRAACMVSASKFKEAEDLLTPFVEKYAGGGKGPDKTPATQEMMRKLDQAGIKAGDAFLALVERSVFYRALARFEQGRFDEARQDFTAFEKQYPKSALLAEVRFRLAQALYRQEKFADAADAYKAVAEGAGDFAASAAFERGLALHKAKDLKAASAAFADAAKRFPESAGAPKARLYAGTCLFEAADYGGAIEQLRPLADDGKQPAAEALYWIGMSHLKGGKPADAEKAFADALKLEPPQPLSGDIQLGLADARLAQNQFATAAEAFRGYAGKNPKAEPAARALYSACVALHRADKYAESDEACAELLKAAPHGDLAAQALFLSGENRFLQKKYDEAARRYEELIERKDAPADRAANAHYRLAWVHRYASRYDRALEELGRMNAADAGKTVAAEALYLKGVCLFEKAQHSEAATALRAYLDSGDRSRFGDDARLKMAVCMAKQNLKKEATAEFQQFLRDYPNSELANQARYQQAECLYDLKEFGRALDQYREVAKHQPPDELTPYALFGAASCAYEQSKWAPAAEEFGALAAKFKESALAPQAFYRQGKSLMNLSRWADAEAAFRALLAAAPKDALARPAQVAIGTCMQEQKKWKEAADAFRSAIHDYPAGDDQPRLHYELAWSLREAGENDKARAAFQALADKFPGDALAADAFFYIAEALYAGRPQSAADAASADDAKTLDEARKLYEKALAAAKDQRLTDKAHYRIGWCYWLTRKYAEAAAEFDKLIKDCPASELLADSRFQAGLSFAKAGEAGPAVERFQALIDSPAAKGFTYLPETYVALGENLLILERPDDALKALAAFLDKFEKHATAAQAYFLQGKAQYRLKKNAEALASFGEVTRRTKAEIAAQAQFYTGQIHQGQEDFKTALLDYLRIPALYPEAREWIAASTFESGKCFDALGQKDEARKAYKDLADNYKDTKWAGLAADRLK